MTALASDCHPSLPSTAPTSFKIETTDLVVINSSAPRGIGPHARVLKRMDNKYMLPRSPESPTLQMQQRRKTVPILGREISRSLRARRTAQYAFTRVNKLEVEPFQVAETLLPPRPHPATPSSWSPTFPVIQVDLKCIDVSRAPTFDPLAKCTSSFSQLLSLDSLPALGLAEDEFWKLFSKCTVCHNFMTSRTIPYHICPETVSKFRVENGSTPPFFLRLLDAHDAGHEAGVPGDLFKAIFYTCRQCGCYMTERISLNHNEADSDTDDQRHIACIYLRAHVGSTFNARKRTLKEFPTLELL